MRSLLRLLPPVLAMNAFASALAENPGTNEMPETIHAKDFGVQVESHDNTAALRAAIAACRDKTNCRLILPPGTLRFASGSFKDTKSLCLIQNAEGLSIEGEGTEILVTGEPADAVLFDIEYSKSVTFSGLTFDYEQAMGAQGKIVSFDSGGSLEIALDPAFPLAPGRPIATLIDCDPMTGVMLANLDLHGSAITSVKELESGNIEVLYTINVDAGDPDRKADLKALEKVLPGQKVLLRQYAYDGFIFRLTECEGVTFRDITIHSVPGMGVQSALSRNIRHERFVIEPREGSGRLISATKDGLHYSHAAGEVSFHDCRFDAIGDDAINVYAKMRNVSKVIGQSFIEMIFDRHRGWQGPTPQRGENLIFWAGATMKPLGSARVSNAGWDPDSKIFRVRFNGKLPEGLAPGDWISSETYLPSVEVRDSSFRGMLGRAMVFSTNNVTVDNCDIEATAYTGILLTSGARHERQGPSPQNVRITNNRFKGTGGAAIYGYIVVPEPTTEAMGDILISGNTFSEDPRLAAMRLKTRRPDWLHWSAGLSLVGGNNIRIEENTFSGYAISIYLNRVRKVSIKRNSSSEATLAVVNRGREVDVANNPGFTLERDHRIHDSELRYIGIIR